MRKAQGPRLEQNSGRIVRGLVKEQGRELLNAF